MAPQEGESGEPSSSPGCTPYQLCAGGPGAPLLPPPADPVPLLPFRPLSLGSGLQAFVRAVPSAWSAAPAPPLTAASYSEEKLQPGQAAYAFPCISTPWGAERQPRGGGGRGSWCITLSSLNRGARCGRRLVPCLSPGRCPVCVCGLNVPGHMLLCHMPWFPHLQNTGYGLVASMGTFLRCPERQEAPNE